MRKYSPHLLTAVFLLGLFMTAPVYATAPKGDAAMTQSTMGMFKEIFQVLSTFIRFLGITFMLFGLATVGISYRNSGGEDSQVTQGVLMIAVGAAIYTASMLNATSADFVSTMLKMSKVAFVAGGGILTVLGLGNVGLSISTSQPATMTKALGQVVGGIIIVVAGYLFTGIQIDLQSGIPMIP